MKQPIDRTVDRDRPNDDNRTIPVIEEQLNVGKETVETGHVRVRKEVQSKELVVEAPVVHDHITIERVKINKFVEEAPPAVRYEGDVMVVAVMQEEIVVQKKLLLVEELRISRQKVQERSEQSVTVRKEEISIEHERLQNPGFD